MMASLLLALHVAWRYSSYLHQQHGALADLPQLIASNQALWQQALPKEYPLPHIIRYNDTMQTPCGPLTKGFFYCPVAQSIYLDNRQLQQLWRFSEAGTFAIAYLLAHQMAHHLQRLLGIHTQVKTLQQKHPQAQKLATLLELQADCLAGVWGYYADINGLINPKKLKTGLRLASSMQALQPTQLAIIGEQYRHATPALRQYWFERGFRFGKLSLCNPFHQSTPPTNPPPKMPAENELPLNQATIERLLKPSL